MSIISRNIGEMPKSIMSKFLEHNRVKPNRIPSLLNVAHDFCPLQSDHDMLHTV